MTHPSTLQDRAMLTVLTISQWTNRKHDKIVSAEVEVSHAAKDAGRYNKQLINKAALDPISKIAGAARDYHYKVTLPWGNNGERLLPAALFLDYAENMRMYKDTFAQRAREFVGIYPDLVRDARTRLGSMYNALDYPAASDIADKFDIATSFTPVPSANDFRVDLSEEYVDKIKSEITSAVEERQRDAVKHCWDRVRDVVGKIHERLEDKDKTFRDSLIENARELVSILPALNITGDPELISIEADVKTLLVHPDVLRNNPVTRSETAVRAAEIMKRMEAFRGN
jgi:hypothetical protein